MCEKTCSKIEQSKFVTSIVLIKDFAICIECLIDDQNNNNNNFIENGKTVDRISIFVFFSICLAICTPRCTRSLTL